MEFRKTRHIDSDEPDEKGLVDYVYEYDIYQFIAAGLCFTARSYTCEPEKAHFLRKETFGQRQMLTSTDFEIPLMRVALEKLRGEGKSVISFLNPITGAYESIRTD